MQLYGLNIANVSITSMDCRGGGGGWVGGGVGGWGALLLDLWNVGFNRLKYTVISQYQHQFFSVTQFLANMDNAGLVFVPPRNRNQMCQRHKACYIKSSILTGLYWGDQC